ncbi:hypothetical protein GIB67_034201 [Kingdonia uniflora]|uniref:RCC1-like domain-containing protein n=1 Tax=Kingdonia uniflora TaxID=39325 RepID=A0A7J7NRL4_9MAGN|nr:hypothetical protein GIB67_034201 [Kingdonia uniflora]
MESPVPLLSKKQNHQNVRKLSSGGLQKDLWSVTREGTLHEVDSILAVLKKNGGNINSRNLFGLTALHIATWRNHVPIVRRLLAAGADPDARDGESGWSSLHRALHFGHLAVAGVLIQAGASFTLEDSKGRTPSDLLSGPVLQVVGNGRDSVAAEIFSWGSGANYQLGTGFAHIQKLPCKVDTLQGSYIKMVSAAKFHSVAIGAHGEVYTWGFGRGGRLGHPDFDIHSGQAAVITPRQVTSGLGSRRVRAVAAAKHHTVVATEGGELFSWGSNREGQLGYTSVDTQPTPRRVSSLRTKIVAVAAANKHTAVICEHGEVFTWGCNKEGQLGYGTSNSASNYTPRVVEYLKGKVFAAVAAAKYHTVVLGADGEVFTWGHRLVTPRRVVIARNIKKSGGTLLKFHRLERLRVVAIAAGMVHSTALTDDGALFYWVSSDPNLRCQQLYSMCGRNVVSISAGKYWTSAVTTTGDVYMWDGKKAKEIISVPTRLNCMKHAISVSVGETHLLIVCAFYHPAYLPKLAKSYQKPVVQNLEEFDEDFVVNDMKSDRMVTTVPKDSTGNWSVPSLKSLCEKVAAESMVEPKNSVQLLEIADSLGADELRKHCEDMAIRNLDYIFTVSAQAVGSASLDILANLERLLDTKSSESWSYRRLPTPTATFPAIINSEEEGSDTECLRVRNNCRKPVSEMSEERRLDYFLQSKDGADEAIVKQVRALRKKLQQVEMLEAKQSKGHFLDDQQIAKLQTRSSLESSLVDLGVSFETLVNPSLPTSLDPKESRKMDVTRKQKRKSKQKVTTAPHPESSVEPQPIKEYLCFDTPQILEQKDPQVDFQKTYESQDFQVSSLSNAKKDISNARNTQAILPAVSKKKNKKGGLSMFLSGALDDTPKEALPPPPTPKTEGPAWGGVTISKGLTSLREIQSEQSKKRGSYPSSNAKDEGAVEEKSGAPARLSSFIGIGGRSNPIAVVSSLASSGPDGEKTPSWTAAGSSPASSRPSLRDIQMQQEKHQYGAVSHSPKTRTAGFSVTTGQGSPSDTSASNRWFKPEIDSTSSIRSIQIEEKAMKDLKRFYSSVKLVKNYN